MAVAVRPAAKPFGSAARHDTDRAVCGESSEELPLGTPRRAVRTRRCRGSLGGGCNGGAEAGRGCVRGEEGRRAAAGARFLTDAAHSDGRRDGEGDGHGAVRVEQRGRTAVTPFFLRAHAHANTRSRLRAAAPAARPRRLLVRC